MATAITFKFLSGNLYSFLQDSFTARSQIRGARGYAIRTNGLDPNLKLDSDAGLSDLLLRAPADEVYPATTSAPDPYSKIFGNDYRWRIRWKNSQTGEVSGLSPIPAVGLNLGVEPTTGSYVGQRAYFTIYGVNSTFTNPLATTRVGVDTIQLFRNTSGQSEIWYLVDEKSNPGSASTVSFEDNFPDEEIWNNEIAGIIPNPSYYTPHPPPCVHSFQHSTGRLWLYGTIQMGAYRVGTADATIGSTTILGTSTHWHRGMEGQQIRFITDPDRVVYRIVQVSNQRTMAVTPPAPAANTGAYEILDDRDGRNIYMMQPLSPAQHDPLDVLTVGLDRADPVKFVFGLGSSTFALTRHRLYELENSQTESPRVTTRFVERAPIGCVGLWAACEVPGGVVFVSDTGVMLFDGQGLPTPLGGGSPLDDFLPKTQFAGIDRGVANDIYAYWDDVNKRVGISYCPAGVMAQARQLSYDPKAGWRGPWRRPVFSAGHMRNADGRDVFLLGDQLGNLLLEEDIVTDLVTPQTGTISTVEKALSFTATGTPFASDCTGASIVFDDGAGNYYVNWIAKRISSSRVYLWLMPEAALTAGWTFKVGGIHWTAKTAFIDGGESMLPKNMKHLGMRWERVSGVADNLVVEAISDGGTITESADTASPLTGGLVKGDANLNVGGTAFTLRLSGRAIYGHPRITAAYAQVNVRSGTSEATASVSSKVVLTPTVTP